MSCGLFSYFVTHYTLWDPQSAGMSRDPRRLRPLKAPAKQGLDSQGPRLTHHYADELRRPLSLTEFGDDLSLISKESLESDL